MRAHEEFLELCAVSTSGDLSENERKKLRDHLAGCPECRQSLKEFEAVADIGVPLLSSELAPIPSEHPHLAPSEISGTITRSAPTANDVRRGLSNTDLFTERRKGHGSKQVNWNYVWVSLAAGVLLTVALGLYSYQAGKRQSLNLVRLAPPVTDTTVGALEQQMSDVAHERVLLKGQLTERDKVIADLRRQLEQESASLNDLKTTQTNLERSIQNGDAEKQFGAQERGALAQKLDAAQQSAAKTQAELDSLRHERSQDQIRVASLEEKINNLSIQLRDREETAARQEELLAHDRDIRELMGARDLYIAEVYDVARDGATQKPYGRVFYTRGKSLVFYAYDLDQQAGIKNANTFQAWGRRGPDRQQALNLGIFYEDSESKKRWVLKFDDSKMLQQIDAVFVTLEPNGGSHKPSGTPLLFAYLKLDPNHP